MNISVQQLAEAVSGEVTGNGGDILTHPAKIEQASEGAIAFLANLKYEDYLYNTKATAVLIPKDFTLKTKTPATTIRVSDPYSSFVHVLNLFQEQLFTETGIHASAVVHETATIGEDVYIGANAVISEGASVGSHSKILPNVTIGKYAKLGSHCFLYPNVSVYHYCELGDRNIIHSGVVIGSDGFGFAPDANGVYSKVPQLGNVVTGTDVEIGANSSIDRATMGSTIIGNGVKIDNLVQLAHNVVIDDHTVIAAQVGISGSTKLGKHVVVGGQAGFVGHIEIADQTKINAKSGISKSITKKGTFVSGTPAFDWRDELKSKSVFKRLPELEQRVADLEKKLKG